MADTFGAVTIPIQVPADGEAVSDPALTYLGLFCKAVLNEYSAEAWATVDKNNPPVKEAFAHDPEQVDISDRYFPAIFVWRDGSQTVPMADDFAADVTRFSILWLFEPMPQHLKSKRAPFLNGVLKPLYRAFQRGRSPAWVVDGEDAAKVSRGSLIWSRCGFTRERLVGAQLEGITIELIEHGKSREYDGVLITLEAEERLFEDPSAYVGGGSAALTADIKNGAANLLRAVEKPPEA